MDKCSKKDCVDFDVSKEDMDLAGNCNMCMRNRKNPTWPEEDDQYLKLEGKPVNPTDDVPPETAFDLKDDDPVRFTPIPVMEDRRTPETKFIPFTSATKDTPYIEESAEIPEEVYNALPSSSLNAGWRPNSTQKSLLESPAGMHGMEAKMDAEKKEYGNLKPNMAGLAFAEAQKRVKDAEATVIEPIVQRMKEFNQGFSNGFEGTGYETGEEKDIKDSGKRTEFETGAVRDAQGGKGRFDLIPNMAVWALAHHTEKGCVKYGDRNWEKGIPIKNFIDSAKRHITEFELGLADENHLAAALWNIACCYETMLRIDMGILPESLDADLSYPLRGVIEDSEMVMVWDRLRHPKVKTNV
jgi:hypothetical protein